MARVVWWLIPLLLAAAPVKGLVRTTVPFDSDWRFLKADAPGAEQPEFADAAWRTLDVPHDWSIEGPFDQKNPWRRGAGDHRGAHRAARIRLSPREAQDRQAGFRVPQKLDSESHALLRERIKLATDEHG